MTGDGNFRWYIGEGTEPEYYSNSADTREAVLALAPDCEGDFTIVEADKSVIAPIFNEGRIAEIIQEDLCESNEECFGEDGYDDVWSKEATQALERALQATVTAWLKEHPGKTWSIGTIRNQEYHRTAVTEVQRTE